jgi:hypothetical protein
VNPWHADCNLEREEESEIDPPRPFLGAEGVDQAERTDDPARTNSRDYAGCLADFGVTAQMRRNARMFAGACKIGLVVYAERDCQDGKPPGFRREAEQRER